MRRIENLNNEAGSASTGTQVSPLPAVAFVVLGMLFHTTAQAVTYNITAVLDGSSGFGASLFHDASGSNPMSGSTLAEIDEVPGNYGTYDSVTGAFAATGLQLVGGGSFTLTGNLLFGGTDGVLQGLSTLDVDVTGGPGGAVADTTLGFNPGYVCCGSSNQDPNSFNADPASVMTMTLWGANFTDATFVGNFPGSTLGMDIRLELMEITPDPIPLPAAAWLFGSALLGLGVVKRKKA